MIQLFYLIFTIYSSEYEVYHIYDSGWVSSIQMDSDTSHPFQIDFQIFYGTIMFNQMKNALVKIKIDKKVIELTNPTGKAYYFSKHLGTATFIPSGNSIINIRAFCVPETCGFLKLTNQDQGLWMGKKSVPRRNDPEKCFALVAPIHNLDWILSLSTEPIETGTLDLTTSSLQEGSAIIWFPNRIYRFLGNRYLRFYNISWVTSDPFEQLPINTQNSKKQLQHRRVQSLTNDDNIPTFYGHIKLSSSMGFIENREWNFDDDDEINGTLSPDIIVVIVICIFAFAVICVFLALYLYRRSRRRNDNSDS